MKNKAAERKCIVNGEVDEKIELLRFTEVDGQLVPDFDKKLPGRGAYVTNSLSALQKAIQKKLFSKAFKKNLAESDEVVRAVENLLKKKGLSSISLAKKAGVLITGFEKVRELIIKNKASFLIEGEDSGDDGRKKILSLAKDLKIFSFYKIEELDKALDRVNTVHVAVKASKIADMVYNDLSRIEKFLNS